MKYKDYVRLSKISLKARKKTTRSTVRGISFGLILLMPLLFIVIAFHMDLNKEVNKDASIRVFDITYSNYTTQENYVMTMLEKNEKKLYELDGIENIIKYTHYEFNNTKENWDSITGESSYSARFMAMLNNKSFHLDKNGTVGNEEYKFNSKLGIQIIDTETTNNIFMESDYQIINGSNPLVAGKVFSENNSSKEIMVSSNFLSHYELSVEDVLNQTITVNYLLDSSNSNITTSKDTQAGNFQQYGDKQPVTLFKDYKIVGIYNSDIYKSANRQKYVTYNINGKNSLYDTYFWLTSDSVYNAMNVSYLPEPIVIEKEYEDGSVGNNNYYYYSSDIINLSNSAKSNGCVFIPAGMGATIGNSSNYYSNTMPVSNAYIEFKSYKDANNAVSIINDLFKETSVSSDEINIGSEAFMQPTFSNYRMFYNVFTYACIVLAIFGGIVFFATLLNLYNTIHYSVQSRRNYLGLTRAIGMKGKEVVKLYFVEIFQIFKKSYIWTAIFGGGICGGICYLFKMIMESDMAAIITIDLSLNPLYILVTFVLLIIINTIISIVFSLVACHNVANKPILDVLVENR